MAGISVQGQKSRLLTTYDAGPSALETQLTEGLLILQSCTISVCSSGETLNGFAWVQPSFSSPYKTAAKVGRGLDLSLLSSQVGYAWISGSLGDGWAIDMASEE